MAKRKQLQSFEYGTITRDKVKLADYNPRIIDESNLKELTKGLRTFGLIKPLVINKRTGNLVEGHQRIAAMDKMYRKKDYEIPVAYIDVDEKEERRSTSNSIIHQCKVAGTWAP